MVTVISKMDGKTYFKTIAVNTEFTNFINGEHYFVRKVGTSMVLVKGTFYASNYSILRREDFINEIDYQKYLTTKPNENNFGKVYKKVIMTASDCRKYLKYC